MCAAAVGNLFLGIAILLSTNIFRLILDDQLERMLLYLLQPRPRLSLRLACQVNSGFNATIEPIQPVSTQL